MCGITGHALTLTFHLLIAWHPAHGFGFVLSVTPAISLTTPYSFDPISALDSDYPIFSPDPSSPAFQPKVYSTPTSTSPGSQALNTFSTPSFGPPTFSSIVTPDLDPSSIATNSSDGSTVPYSESTVPWKDNNWRTLVINANSIANKKS